MADSVEQSKSAVTRVPRIGVGAIVLYEHTLLMVQRAGAHGAGTWCPPGGHLEYGESPEACAEREVLEETGVVVRAVKRLPYTNDYVPDWVRHYVTLHILCQYVSGEPRVIEPAKCPQVAWVLLDAVTCRELFLPIKNLLHENPGILRQAAYPKEA